ncbi:uncharacterized protein LOC141597448 [Silene latifolia]|uniref:uncharacterized protein LOC141597448 n=1 Tax=Silene latifolia TaxID=37657 RepID=UPI003D7794FA
MSNLLEEIKSKVLSASKSEKAYAYSTLQHLQEQSNHDNSLLHSLINSSLTILSSIVADIRVHHADEQIVELALKCLGFMIYHPSIVAAIPKQCINEVLESLARLITTTKIKVVCNLGVWCISMQQLDASSLVLHFDSLLRSIVYSLDNPAGSLSTTFEGIQAVMKLGAQLSEKMRDASSIWAPPIYRRLLSTDKRERDMCQRCLLKIKCLIIPPQQALSKAIAHEMKLKLLPAMKELLKQGKKVQALLAWRWFICILGYHSLKSRHLVNELLKVPEQTFSDSDSQVQIATLVAWEGLIDALVAFPSKICDSVTTHQPHIQHVKVKSGATSQVDEGVTQTGVYSKGLKLIMTPIIGIMTSKTEFSVQSSCLNTWYYLLHKLDNLVSDTCVLATVVEPMLKAVFSVNLDDTNIWSWSVCTNLLHDFIQSKSSNNNLHTEVSFNSSPRTTDSSSLLSGNSSLKAYSVKWLSWDVSQMDFLVRMIQMTLSQTAVATLSSENSSLICDVILRMFRSFLKGVQLDLAKSPTSHDAVMLSLNAVFGLVKTLCKTALCVDGESTNFHVIGLRSLEAVVQELDSSILGSPLYKIPLDVEYVCQGEARCKPLVGSVSLSFMDMVTPVTYLTVLYYYVVVTVRTKVVMHEFTLQGAFSYLNSVLSSYELLEVVHATAASLYTCVNNSSMRVWITIARCLRDHLNGAKDLLPLKIQPASSASNTLCKFLIFPLVVCSSCKSLGTPKECNPAASSIFSGNCTFDEVIDVWMSLYSHVNCTNLQEFPRKNWFTEELCLSLNDFLHQQSDLSESGNSPEHQLLSLCGDIGKCILENLNVEKVAREAIKCNFTGSSGINNCLEFIARLMNLVWTKMEEPPRSVVISRLLPSLIQVVSRLHWQEDITSFIKVLGEPVLPWMSDDVGNSEIIKHELSLLWAEIIKSLHRSWPSIEFNSSYLKQLAVLLEKTLDHSSPSISEPTIKFWNSAYGDQSQIDVPPSLSPVLGKLARDGRIKIRKKRAAGLDPPSHKVSATLRVCSKRVELVQNLTVSGDSTREQPPRQKRERRELTEHQREVRRAQQGKGRDCSGHGPGVRTYTSVDFSQGNDESQDSEDIRDADLILDLLKRV